MRAFPRILDDRLSRARSQGLGRELQLPFGVDFSSNDYLGFARDPELQRRTLAALPSLPMGATASRLLRGNLETHLHAERELAEFSGQEDALLYSSGYQANVGLCSALLSEGDVVYSDSSNHASIIDGIRLSKGQKRIYGHLDLQRLQDLLEADREIRGLKLIVTESVFSMDGDFAPLEKIVALAESHDAWLIVDEAHATGLWGAGRIRHLGLEHRVLATVHTGGKALGSGGAWIAGSAALKSCLVNFSRSQIFSTSPSPYGVEALRQAVHFHGEVGASRIETLRNGITLFLEKAGLEIPAPDERSPIIPWIVGDAERAVDAARELREQGIDVRAIRPPTVPADQCRLRITLKSTNTESEIARLAHALRSIPIERRIS